MATQQPLSTYLLNSCPHTFTLATTHPFLRLAGTGRLPKSVLSQWLAQDRIYAQNYVRFIGLMLAKLRLSRDHNPTSSARPGALTVENRIFDLLVDALLNIKRELAFFENVAAQYALDLTAVSSEDVPRRTTAGVELKEKDRCASREEGGGGTPGKRAGFETARKRAGAGSASLPGEPLKPVERGCTVFFGPNRVTRAYVDLFMSAGASGVPLLEGMVVLWATEYAYLQAWKYASSVAKGDGDGGGDGQRRDPKDDLDGGALREQFIPNWSSDEFEAFVNRIRDLVDEMVGNVKGAEEGELMREQCLEWWRQVLWLEEQFWPDVEGLE